MIPNGHIEKAGHSSSYLTNGAASTSLYLGTNQKKRIKN
jgi:hypothetical protein